MGGSDRFESDDTRAELTAVGSPTEAVHQTRGELTDGLEDWFTVGGAAVAVVGSSGPNTSPDHQSAKAGAVLVPLDPTVKVLAGSGLLAVGGKAAAQPDSECLVPDSRKPTKSCVLHGTADWFVIEGEPVVRGPG